MIDIGSLVYVKEVLDAEGAHPARIGRVIHMLLTTAIVRTEPDIENDALRGSGITLQQETLEVEIARLVPILEGAQ